MLIIFPKTARHKPDNEIWSGVIRECNKRNIFLYFSSEYEVRRLAPDFFLFFKKALY